MNDARDPFLESMFVQAEQNLADDDYIKQVMDRVEKRRRNVLAGQFALILLLVVFELLLSAPLQNTVGAITQALSESLLELENEWIALLFAPMNSIAGLIGIMLLGMQFLYRKIMH
ncbi:MAG: hypothetical protein ACR2Q3_05790 [Woeseiaceae bacterium]